MENVTLSLSAYRNPLTLAYSISHVIESLLCVLCFRNRAPASKGEAWTKWWFGLPATLPLHSNSTIQHELHMENYNRPSSRQHCIQNGKLCWQHTPSEASLLLHAVFQPTLGNNPRIRIPSRSGCSPKPFPPTLNLSLIVLSCSNLLYKTSKLGHSNCNWTKDICITS